MSIPVILDSPITEYDVFINDIDKYVTLWCENNGIEDKKDICNISQNRFSALLYFLYRNVFINVNLKMPNVYNTGLMISNNNAYDVDIVNNILDVYMSLCDTFDKIISVQGFCKLTGIDEETIYGWGRDGASGKRSAICKKLISERERTLSDRLASGKVNPVGVLGCLNHWHGWSGVGNMQEDKTKQSVTLSDVRKNAALLSDNLTTDNTQTAENTPLELSDNLTQLESQ